MYMYPLLHLTINNIILYYNNNNIHVLTHTLHVQCSSDNIHYPCTVSVV